MIPNQRPKSALPRTQGLKSTSSPCHSIGVVPVANTSIIGKAPRDRKQRYFDDPLRNMAGIRRVGKYSMKEYVASSLHVIVFCISFILHLLAHYHRPTFKSSAIEIEVALTEALREANAGVRALFFLSC